MSRSLRAVRLAADRPRDVFQHPAPPAPDLTNELQEHLEPLHRGAASRHVFRRRIAVTGGHAVVADRTGDTLWHGRASHGVDARAERRTCLADDLRPVPVLHVRLPDDRFPALDERARTAAAALRPRLPAADARFRRLLCGTGMQ